MYAAGTGRFHAVCAYLISRMIEKNDRKAGRTRRALKMPRVLL